MNETVIREARESDWPAILELANQSVAHVPGAPIQEAWWHNRKRFDPSVGLRRHFVAETSDGGLLGYAAVESPSRDGVYRLFLVTLPSRLPTIGEALYQHALALLLGLDARRLWFTEYAGDAPLLDFVRSRGFREARRISVEAGLEAVTLVKESPFEGPTG